MQPANLFDYPDLPANVGAWMSTREGGYSGEPWDSFNLGDHVGDAPERVQANRQRLADTLGVRPVFLQQVHGTGVLELDAQTPDGAVADACFTFAAGLACTIMVADCLPVLLWDVRGQWVAAAHAGWRGLAGQQGVGVLEALWSRLKARGAMAETTGVWLGPCIGPQAFEVGPEVRQAFLVDQPELTGAFKPAQGDRWLADLPALARARLLRLGLTQVDGNDGSPHWCTVSRPALFFSHRRDAARLGSTGRMAACIWRL
ncbi:peptidoglycan editing factor PgeF [Limnohabitans sp.]|uniref:peptidoglycan editing factor PgeF n=1 Tax=Limnohabitans sp. TaxID=1907725 RepID=UPI0035B1836A